MAPNELMLWNQPFGVISLQKGGVVIHGTNFVQGPRQWPRRPAQVKIQSLGLFVARVNESERSRNEKRAISLVFALATNKAESWIFWIFGFWIGEAHAQNWSPRITTSPFWRLITKGWFHSIKQNCCWVQHALGCLQVTFDPLDQS